MPAEGQEYCELFAHFDDENRLRLEHILAVRVKDTHDAIRAAETTTKLDSAIGRTNLNEAFSHVSELARETTMSVEDQASHLADIEDHLRRAVLEHTEQVVRAKLVEISEHWQTYLSEARPFRQQNAMVGVPRHSELETDRQSIRDALEYAREKKTGRRSWEETLEIARRLGKAAETADALDDKLVQCIGAAAAIKQERVDVASAVQAEAAKRQADNRHWRIGMAVTLIVAVLGWAVAIGEPSIDGGNTATAHARTVTQTVTVTATERR